MVWTSIENSYDTGDEVPLVLYSTTKPRLLNKHTWLNNTELRAGQALLKNKFPKIDGLRDPSKYCLEVAPAKSPENTGFAARRFQQNPTRAQSEFSTAYTTDQVHMLLSILVAC